MSAKTNMVVFDLHPDQETLVTTAIEHIQDMTGTAYPSVALGWMALEYLGAGLRFPDWKASLLYFRKHSDLEEFLSSVIPYLESICPEATIMTEVTLKEQVKA
jgi:hypothetical protein